MKMIKMALLGGAALTATAVAAHADDLDALKAQIEALNARVAAMETAPSVPAGYQLLAVSEGDMQPVPGLEVTGREKAAEGSKATIISVLPTADAPAGTTISWSGYAKAGLVYTGEKIDDEVKLTTIETTDLVTESFKSSTDTTDTDVLARGQIRVKGSTDTSVGEVGAEVKIRGDFDGNGSADAYVKTAWGYWSLTPELTLGGGYSGSLGNIGYGLDGACNCYYTDNADVDFNPGDVTQFRLSYQSGPVSFGVALEDASQSKGAKSSDKLGVAGEVKYSGDSFSGEISGVWRDRDDNDVAGVKDLWQVGAGLDFSLGDVASLSVAAALGEGPYQSVAPDSASESGEITSLPINQSWWGASALASAKLSDAVHTEIAAGYKERTGDDITIGDFSSDGLEYSTWSVLGGIYYDPVDQLTIGLEAEYYTTSTDFTFSSDLDVTSGGVTDVELSRDTENVTLDLVSVWRF